MKYVKDDPQKIIEEVLPEVQAKLGEVLYPGDERRILTEVFAQLIATERAHQNATANRKFLKNMWGIELDEYGEARNVPRLQPVKAKAKCLFTLPAPRPQDEIIPKGSKLTADSKVYFETLASVTIPRGSTSVVSDVECTQAGILGNGYLAGSIKSLVNPLTFAVTVENIIESYGGSDAESDERYKERLQLAPSGYPTAGPEDAYIFHAKTADINANDVVVTSPSPCVIKVMVLMVDGRVPTVGELETIELALSAKTVRPLTDQVQVVAPTVETYNIQAIYYISKEKALEEQAIKANIENEGGAASKYVAWQRSKIDPVINPDMLKNLLMNEGAFRVDVTSPTIQVLTGGKAAQLGILNLTYGGLL